MKLVLIALGLIFAWALPATAADTPPSPYIDKDACPFDGCMYGEWDVLKETKLYAAPDSDKVVGVARPGDKIKGLTGDVYVTPGLVEILKDHDSYKAGDKVYPMTNYGEGIYLVWYQGRTYDDGIIYQALDEEGQAGKGPNAKAAEWGKLIRQPVQTDWWVQVQLPNGTTGWSREHISAERNFCSKGQNDGCTDAY